MKKILFIDISLSFGGAIKSISQFISEINRNDFLPVIVVENDIGLIRNILPKNIKIYKVPHIFNYRHFEGIALSISKLKNNILRKIIFYSCSLSGIILNLYFFLKLLIIILREKPDILHINNGMEIDEANLLGTLLNIPTVVHQRGDSEISFFRKIFIKNTQIFIAVSTHTKKNMISKKIPKEKIVVCHDPVSYQLPNVLELRNRYKISQNEICFGIFGRIVPWKGQEVFVRAAVKVLSKYKNTKAFIIGDSADFLDDRYCSNIEKIANESDVKERIIFTGYVENVHDYYGLMDIVVHASILPEPFGMVINEAMMYGVPVIASNQGGPIDIIDDGINGILIKPNDANTLSEAMENLYLDTEKRKKLGEQARLKAMKSYNLKTYARRIEALYYKLIKAISK